MIERMCEELANAKQNYFVIENKNISFSNNFDLADFVEHETYYAIDELEFDKTDNIERIQDDDSIEYRFTYENIVLSLIAYNGEMTI